MIRVSSYPFRRSHDSLAESVEANDRAPLQARARADTELLRGSTLAAHTWSDESCSLHFSNGRSLVVHIDAHEVDWGISDNVSTPPSAAASPTWGPATLSWSGLTDPIEFDPNSLLSALHGAAFHQLYYLADLGWLALYTLGNEPLSLYALRREDSGQDMLYAAWLA